MLAAPWLMRVLAPGLDPQYFDTSVNILRILALSTLAAGVAAVHCAMLYTHRRFGPAAFYQAALNVFTIAGALILWKFVGVYAFAIGYTAGAFAQLAIVYFAARSGLKTEALPECPIRWREILMKPAFFVVYAAGIGLNITFTRAYATHAGPGMAAALDYCMRGVAVPLALLVQPISNSLLPEIARLRSLLRLRDALRLIDKTIALAALVAVVGCGFALAFCRPAIALLFQHGSFTADSTRLVASAFLALGPSLIGWSLMEILARSLFALDRPWPPVIAAVHPGADQCDDYVASGHFPPGIPRSGSVGRPDGGFRRLVRDRPHGTKALARAGLNGAALRFSGLLRHPFKCCPPLSLSDPGRGDVLSLSASPAIHRYPVST